MADQIIQYRGTVLVPLFITPWKYPLDTFHALNTGISFNDRSFAPFLNYTPFADNNLQFENFVGLVPNLDNPAVQKFNETITPVGPWSGALTWADNKACCVIDNVTGGSSRYCEVFLPRISGDWSASISSKNSALYANVPTGPVSDVFPFIDVNGFHWRGFWTMAGGGTGGEPWVAYANGDQGGKGLTKFPGLTIGRSFPQLFTGQTWANVYNPAILTNDNVNRWVVPGQGSTNPHPPILMRYLMDPLLPSSAQVLSLALSDPTLDAFFQSAFRVSASYNSFIITMFTNGAGPTGQLFEVLYCDKDLRYYTLLKFQSGGDPHAQAQLTRSGGPGWNVKTDVEGTLWFNSGNSADIDYILYNFAILGSPWPQVQLPDYPPLKLPCIDPCMDYM